MFENSVGDQLFIKGEAFAIRAGGRSPRVARQFIELLSAEMCIRDRHGALTAGLCNAEGCPHGVGQVFDLAHGEVVLGDARKAAYGEDQDVTGTVARKILENCK